MLSTGNCLDETEFKRTAEDMIKELERFKGETIKCHYRLKEGRNKSATENMQENTKVQLNEIKKAIQAWKLYREKYWGNLEIKMNLKIQ